MLSRKRSTYGRHSNRRPLIKRKERREEKRREEKRRGEERREEERREEKRREEKRREEKKRRREEEKRREEKRREEKRREEQSREEKGREAKRREEKRREDRGEKKIFWLQFSLQVGLHLGVFFRSCSDRFKVFFVFCGGLARYSQKASKSRPFWEPLGVHLGAKMRQVGGKMALRWPTWRQDGAKMAKLRRKMANLTPFGEASW